MKPFLFFMLLLLFQLLPQRLTGEEEVNTGGSTDSPITMLEYYATHGTMTDPGKYAELYEGLPSEVPQLCKVVQGVLIHVFHAHRYGVTLSEERRQELLIRRVEEMLERIAEQDGRPIAAARDLNKRLVGNCRDFSVFLCSLLRHKGLPARVRCGFGSYFTPGRYEDHWVCEFWSFGERRWVLVDAQLDSLQRQAFNIDFDPCDLPSGKFLPAGKLWQSCRAGKLDPDLCGIGDLYGLWFVRGNVVRDLLALNKLELLPWDGNELMDSAKEPNSEQYALLDKAAKLTADEGAPFADIRSLYESNRLLQMPDDWKP